MFGRNDNTPPPAPPGDDVAGEPLTVPRVPRARTYELHRYTPGVINPTVETIVLEAHEVKVAGNLIAFHRYLISKDEGPTNQVVGCFNGWIDYKDITVLEEPSLILSPAEVLH